MYPACPEEASSSLDLLFHGIRKDLRNLGHDAAQL
jgi:hypothetical protein